MKGKKREILVTVTKPSAITVILKCAKRMLLP